MNNRVYSREEVIAQAIDNYKTERLEENIADDVEYMTTFNALLQEAKQKRRPI